MGCYSRYRRHGRGAVMPKRTRRDLVVPRLSGAVVADFMRAQHRVKGEPYARTNVVRWLLNFSFRNSSRLSKAEWCDVQWEALVFAYDAGEANLHPMTPLPTKPDLREIQQWLLRLWSDLGNLGKGDWLTIRPVAPARMLRREDGKLYGMVPPLSVPWSEAFKASVYETLTADEVARRFRFCQECRHPFCARKRQAYCSSSCSQKHRTREWRQKNRVRFRAARRAAYKRK